MRSTSTSRTTTTRARVFTGLLTVVVASATLNAQQVTLAPHEVGQLIDAALANVLPPEKFLTVATVEQRGIRFDFEKTASAFGVVPGSDPVAALGVRRSLSTGTHELLADCSQLGMLPCTRIGNASYVHMEPVSLSRTTAVVWLHVSWATTMASKRSFLSGFGTQVHFSRSDSGAWTFVRTGTTVIS